MSRRNSYEELEKMVKTVYQNKSMNISSKAYDELDKVIQRMQDEIEPEEDYGVINNSNCKPIMIGLIVIILLMGLLDLKTGSYELMPIYYFGFIFFIAGCYVGTTSPFGIIFLFSHGGTGLGLMTVPVIASVLKNPIITENPNRVYMYLGIAAAAVIFAVIKAIMCATREKNIIGAMLQEDPFFEKHRAVVLLLFTIGIVLVQLLPLVVNHLIRM